MQLERGSLLGGPSHTVAAAGNQESANLKESAKPGANPCQRSRRAAAAGGGRRRTMHE